jgi:hypothetical protein
MHQISPGMTGDAFAGIRLAVSRGFEIQPPFVSGWALRVRGCRVNLATWASDFPQQGGKMAEREGFEPGFRLEAKSRDNADLVDG